MHHLIVPRFLQSSGLSRSLRHLFVWVVCLLMLTAMPAPGQSGRKQKRSEPLPPVQGVSQTQPAEKAAPEPEAAAKQPDGPIVMVATEMGDLNIPLLYTDIARQGCVQELRRAKSLEIREARNQTRSEAIKAAKESDRMFVLLMNLEVDRIGNYGFDLRYTIFEPKTGKVIGSGSGYPVAPSSGVPVPPIGASRDEVMVEWAGRDVGRQVLKKLGLRD